MALTKQKRDRLKEIYKSVASPKEVRALEAEEQIRATAKNVSALTEALGILTESAGDSEQAALDAKEAAEAGNRAFEAFDATLAKGLMELSAAIVGKLDELKKAGYQGSEGQEKYALSIQNMAASLAEGFGAVKESIDKKPVPVWNWPQYLYSGVRNTQFQPVDPAVDSMNVGEYDYVSMELTDGDTTETYRFYQQGAPGPGNPSSALQATVVLVYTNSDRNVLVSVTKTPLVTTASN